MNLNVGSDGNYCPCVPSKSFQPRQILDLLIFSGGWIPRTCLSRTAWLLVRAEAPCEACILSFVHRLEKTRPDRNKSFQIRDVLQELFFTDGGAPQTLHKRSELPTARTAAVFEHSLFPSFAPGMPRCCNGQYSRQRPTVPVSIPVARTERDDRWVAGTWLCRADWLAMRMTSGKREGRGAPTPRLAQGDEVERDAAGLLRARTHLLLNFMTQMQAGGTCPWTMLCLHVQLSDCKCRWWGQQFSGHSNGCCWWICRRRQA